MGISKYVWWERGGQVISRPLCGSVRVTKDMWSFEENRTKKKRGGGKVKIVRPVSGWWDDRRPPSVSSYWLDNGTRRT